MLILFMAFGSVLLHYINSGKDIKRSLWPIILKFDIPAVLYKVLFCRNTDTFSVFHETRSCTKRVTQD
jgi:hypothetical protein